MGEHDQLFKAAFRIPANAAGELASVLPPDVIDAIDLSSLELVHGDLVSRQLDERFSDALFRADFKTGTTGFIWLLLEHQSTPDRWMPLRVLEKMVRTWEDWRREKPEATSLPPFICVVVHHGENGWQAATRMHQLVARLDAFPSLKRFVPDFELVVDDLPHQSDAELQRRPLGLWPKLVLWALRDARDEERLLAHLGEWGAGLQQLLTVAPDDVTIVLRYVLLVAGRDSFERIKKRLTETAPDTEKTMQTIAEMLIEQGEARGQARGEMRGRATSVLAVLEARGLHATAEQRDFILSCSDVTRLDQWLREAATASDVSAIFSH